MPIWSRRSRLHPEHFQRCAICPLFLAGSAVWLCPPHVSLGKIRSGQPPSRNSVTFAPLNSVPARSAPDRYRPQVLSEQVFRFLRWKQYPFPRLLVQFDLRLFNGVLQRADVFDSSLHHITRFQQDFRVPENAHTGGGARGDNIASEQRHDTRDP